MTAHQKGRTHSLVIALSRTKDLPRATIVRLRLTVLAPFSEKITSMFKGHVPRTFAILKLFIAPTVDRHFKIITLDVNFGFLDFAHRLQVTLAKQ
jgi:hypothetical protein